MLGLTTQIAMHLALVLPQSTAYDGAYAASLHDGRPLLVLVGADWCPGCRRMKDSNLPEVDRSGGLARVHFAIVNADRQSELAHQLMHGGTIPQLILFDRRADEWSRKQLTGVHSPSEIRRFLASESERGDPR